jgi:hypothetical protein
MASNRLPDSTDLLISLAESAAKGTARLATEIGIKQNSEAAIRADLDALLNSIAAYNTAKGSSPGETGRLNAAALEGRTWLLMARDNFKTFLGNQPGKNWRGAGWPESSIAVPKRADDIGLRLASVAKFLTDHPAREVAAMNLTAARATALYAALRGTHAGRNNHRSGRVEAKRARDAAERQLRRRLRGLIAELAMLLEPTNSHWKGFGLKPPGKPDSPAKVTNTRAQASGGGRVLVQCDAAARAEYYQVHLMVVGRDMEFALAESPRDPQKFLDDLPVGATVRLKMRAMNETGHGPFGEVVEVVVK